MRRIEARKDMRLTEAGSFRRQIDAIKARVRTTGNQGLNTNATDAEPKDVSIE